jgi:hypothetical protein
MIQQQRQKHSQPTITIRDTPSPAVSVITISDSEEEATSYINCKGDCQSCQRNQQANQPPTKAMVLDPSVKCPSVMAMTPGEVDVQQRRANVISCVTVPDSDEERNARQQIQQQQQQQVSAQMSQKKRLLAKAQSECLVPTDAISPKREPQTSPGDHRKKQQWGDVLYFNNAQPCASTSTDWGSEYGVYDQNESDGLRPQIKEEPRSYHEKKVDRRVEQLQQYGYGGVSGRDRPQAPELHHHQQQQQQQQQHHNSMQNHFQQNMVNLGNQAALMRSYVTQPSQSYG